MRSLGKLTTSLTPSAVRAALRIDLVMFVEAFLRLHPSLLPKRREILRGLDRLSHEERQSLRVSLVRLNGPQWDRLSTLLSTTPKKGHRSRSSSTPKTRSPKSG